ncbi:inner nuclear membrane protein heh2-related [Anaeramoeba flamelloides]|uniref:Inner nuclear membrane protein heh2-related n=1 Tax=Anaeramoeba flamelloides TaxID=1746091 RepID=A0AAV7ZFZ5_9EUKA|nr:inner nuclear membrane protein heh2-related [Anaeramoeba flamelloides]
MDQDPNSLSVRELKSFISKYGGHHLLPVDKVKKTEYIKIFQQLALSLQSKQEEESSDETEEETEETEEESEESEEETEEEIPQQKQKQSRTKRITPNKKYKKNISFTEKKRTPKKEKYSQNENHPTNKYYTQQKQKGPNKQIKRQISSETNDESESESENENENEYESESESESDEVQKLDGGLNIESSEKDGESDEEIDFDDNRWEQSHKSPNENTYINQSVHTSQQKGKAGSKKKRSVKKQKVENKMKSINYGNVLKIIFGFLILIAISIILYNYFHVEKKYYCDSFPDITDTKKRECTECPLNGICKYGKLMTCDLGYQKSKNKCIRDSEKKELLNQDIEELLKKRKIEFHCNGEDGRPETEYLNKEELIEILFQERVNYPIEMIELWINNFESYQQDKNLIKKDEEIGFYFDKNPGYPIQCLMKMTLNKYWVTILITSMLLIIVLFVTIRIKQKKKLLFETEHVVNKLKNKLKSQKMLSYSSDVEPYLIVNHERDNMINPNHAKKRRCLWPLVINRIKRDARIAKKTMKYYGDQVTVWEWVDNVPTTKKKRTQKKNRTHNHNNNMGYPTWDDN